MHLGIWICLFLILIPVSSACTPGAADWWFAASLSVKSEPAIPGLTMTVEDGEPFDALQLSYDGEKSVYIGVERESDMVLQRYRNTYGKNGLPYPLTARFRLENDRAYEYDEHHRSYDTGTRKGGRWRIMRKTTYDADLDDAPPRQALELSSEDFQRVSRRYRPGRNPNGNLRRDNRSDNVSLPGNHSFELKLHHGGEQYNLSGIVSYSLNEEYDRWQQREGIERCREFNMVQRPSWFTDVGTSTLAKVLIWWLTWAIV